MRKSVLNEVYQYAYNKTLESTQKTMSGPQHPNYNIQMSGTGDVVLTDINKSSAGLIISENIYGKMFIHNRNNVVIAEIQKSYGRVVRLALEHGNYRITNEKNKKLFETNIKIKRRQHFILKNNNFRNIKKEVTTTRGYYNYSEDQKNTKKNKNVLINMNKVESGGYGGPVLRYTRLGNDNNFLAGARGDWIINQRLVIGGAGYGQTILRKKTIDSVKKNWLWDMAACSWNIIFSRKKFSIYPSTF